MRGASAKPAAIVVVEATTGVLLTGGIAASVVATLLGFIAKHDEYQWPDRTTLAALCDVFTGPLLAGMTCLAAIRRRQQGLIDVAASTVTGRWFPVRVTLLAALVWAVVIALFQMASSTLANPPFGTPFTVWMLVPWLEAVAVLCACAGLGAAVGARSDGIGVAPLVALAVFAWLYGSLQLAGRWSVLAPFDNATFYDPTTEPAPGLLILHIALSAAVLAAGIASLASSRRAAWLLASAAGLVAGAVAAGMLVVSPDRIRYRSFEGTPACAQRATVELCVWPVMAQRLPQQLEFLAKVHDLAEPSWHVGTRYAQAGVPLREGQQQQQLYLQSPSSPYLDAVTAVNVMLPQCQVTTEFNDPRSSLHRWLLTRLGVSSTDPDVVALAAKPEAVQRAWVARQLRAGKCS